MNTILLQADTLELSQLYAQVCKVERAKRIQRVLIGFVQAKLTHLSPVMAKAEHDFGLAVARKDNLKIDEMLDVLEILLDLI